MDRDRSFRMTKARSPAGRSREGDREERRAGGHDRGSRLALLSEMAGRLLGCDRPEAVVGQLCLDVMRHLGCDVFFNYLVDEGSRRLHLNVCGGVPADAARSIEWIDLGAAACCLVAGDGVAGCVGDEPDARTDLVRSMGIRACACHPLVSAEGRVIGTLSFGACSRDRFLADELLLMKCVADLVAAATDRVMVVEAERRRLLSFNAELERRVAERVEELRALATELTQAERRERRRLSGLLHENVQQLLVAAQMQVEVLRRGRIGRTGREVLDQVARSLREAVSASRAIVLEMSPPVLHQAGLAPALSWLARHEAERDGLAVEVMVDGRADPESEDVRALLFECVKELLANVRRHSGVRHARVAMMVGQPDTRVLGLSMHDRSDMAAAMTEAGAAAYLAKGGPADRLVEAIRRCAA